MKDTRTQLEAYEKKYEPTETTTILVVIAGALAGIELALDNIVNKMYE